MRYFISDLDHTLLNEQAQLSVATIAILTAQPVPLMLCSARLPIQMDAFIQQLKLTGPQVALNGAVVFEGVGNNRQIKAKRPVAIEAYQQIVKLMTKHFPEYPVTWMDADYWYFPELTADLKPELQYCQPTDYVIGVTQPKTVPLLLLIVIPDPVKFKEVFDFLSQAQVPNIHLVNSGDGYLTITAQGVDKAIGSQYLIDHQLATKDEIVAFGDDENDLPMLKAAGQAVAVANANPLVKTQADQVVEANVNDGVAKTIQRLLH